MNIKEQQEYARKVMHDKLVGEPPYSWDSTELSLGAGMGNANVQEIYYFAVDRYRAFEKPIFRRIKTISVSSIWNIEREGIYRALSQSIIARAWRNKLGRLQTKPELIRKAFAKHREIISHFTAFFGTGQQYDPLLVQAMHNAKHPNKCLGFERGDMLTEMGYKQWQEQYAPQLRKVIVFLKGIGQTVWDPEARGMSDKTKRRVENWYAYENYLQQKKNGGVQWDRNIELHSGMRTDPAAAKTLPNIRLFKDYVRNVYNDHRLAKQQQFSAPHLRESSLINRLAPPPQTDNYVPPLGQLMWDAVSDRYGSGITFSITNTGEFKHEFIAREESTMFCGGTDPANSNAAFIRCDTGSGTGSGDFAPLFEYRAREGRFMGQIIKLVTPDTFGDTMNGERRETVVTGYNYGKFTQVFYGYNKLEKCLHERYVDLNKATVRTVTLLSHDMQNEADVVDFFVAVNKQRKKKQIEIQQQKKIKELLRIEKAHAMGIECENYDHIEVCQNGTVVSFRCKYLDERGRCFADLTHALKEYSSSEFRTRVERKIGRRRIEAVVQKQDCTSTKKERRKISDAKFRAWADARKNSSAKRKRSTIVENKSNKKNKHSL